MNKKFDGNVKAGSRRGQHSKAAKAAFADIRKDPDMKIKVEVFGVEIEVGVILTEDILDVDGLWGL